MSDTPIDPAVFAELQETMGHDFALELVDAFLDEAPGMFAELNTGAAQADQDQLRRAAHSIKSNANVFGAHDLAEVARQIEVEGLEEGSAQVAVLEAEYERAARALRALRNG